MAGGIRVDDTLSLPVIHFRRGPGQASPCGAAARTPFAKEWRYVTCATCRRYAPSPTPAPHLSPLEGRRPAPRR